MFWTPDASRSGSYKIAPVIIILFRVGRDPFFSKMALMIFLKLGMVVKIDANEKVTKPDYPKKFWFIQKV